MSSTRDSHAGTNENGGKDVIFLARLGVCPLGKTPPPFPPLPSPCTLLTRFGTALSCEDKYKHTLLRPAREMSREGEVHTDKPFRISVLTGRGGR